MLRISNYSSIPKCGAKEVAIYMDSLLIFYGELAKFKGRSTISCSANGLSQYILFTDDTTQVKDGFVNFCGDHEQDVRYIDNSVDRQVS